MQRVESRPAMTALFADHGVTVSAFAPSASFPSLASSSVLPGSVVSIIRPGVIVLLSILALSSLVLTSPAVSR
jgi:hypothetical protein